MSVLGVPPAHDFDAPSAGREQPMCTRILNAVKMVAVFAGSITRWGVVVALRGPVGPCFIVHAERLLEETFEVTFHQCKNGVRRWV